MLSPEQQDAKANLDAVEEKYKKEISYLSQLLTVSEQKQKNSDAVNTKYMKEISYMKDLLVIQVSKVQNLEGKEPKYQKQIAYMTDLLTMSEQRSSKALQAQSKMQKEINYMVALLAKTTSQKAESDKNVGKMKNQIAYMTTLLQKQVQKTQDLSAENATLKKGTSVGEVAPAAQEAVPQKYLDQVSYLIGLLNDTRNKVTTGSETESKLRKEISYLVDLVQQQSSKGEAVATAKNSQDSTSEDSSPSSAAETEKLTTENAKLKTEIAYMIKLLHNEIKQGKVMKMQFAFKEKMITSMEKEMKKDLQYQIDQINLIKAAEALKAKKRKKLTSGSLL